MRSRLCTALVALVAGVGLAACGGGGGEGEGQQGGGNGGSSGTPQTKDQAIARCREEAAKLTGDSRKTAEAACDAGESGDTTGVKDAAREQCLNATADIPDPAAKKQAQEQCKASTQ
jgi:hypothetical protein